MKTKYFAPQEMTPQQDKKNTDYWGLLFVSFILIASMSSFLLGNHLS